MLNRFTQWLRSPKAATVGDERVYAIGDVHGRLDCLKAMTTRIEADIAENPPKNWRIVFLGDLIDRGPDSSGVIDHAMAFGARHQGKIWFISGNHEDMLLRAHDGDGAVAALFYRTGGRETLASYGLTQPEGDRMDRAELVAWMQQYVPQAHIAFLRGFHDWLRIGDYVFVHAGIRPGVPLEDQARADLLWIRSEFLNDQRPHPGIIVHGHSIVPEPERRSNRIAIDTGAFASGMLSALVLEQTAQRFLSVSCAAVPVS